MSTLHVLFALADFGWYLIRITISLCLIGAFCMVPFR
jgi:hypothetical protein